MSALGFTCCNGLVNGHHSHPEYAGLQKTYCKRLPTVGRSKRNAIIERFSRATAQYLIPLTGQLELHDDHIAGFAAGPVTMADHPVDDSRIVENGYLEISSFFDILVEPQARRMLRFLYVRDPMGKLINILAHSK